MNNSTDARKHLAQQIGNGAVLIHSGKITYNGVSSVYNWYYGIDNSSLNKKITQDEETIKMLEDRVENLECIIEKYIKEKTALI